jgi:hypothetical protein
LALIGLVAFWLMRRRRAANENHNVAMAVASDAKPDPSVADRSPTHPSVYYGAGSPGMTSPMAPASPPVGKYYQGELPSAVASTPSPVNGYMNPQHGEAAVYQQQAAYGGAAYPPQQAQYPPPHGQYSPQPSQYSPQPYPTQYATPPPPMNTFPPQHNAAELASGPMTDAPQELWNGTPAPR